MKFQTNPENDFSEIHIHVRFHSFDAKAQQEVLGLMGINLCGDAKMISRC